jgi:microcystin degradation protein MlrC
MPRILFAGLFHETHTFLGQLTRWDDFEIAAGADILTKRGNGSPTDGFLTVAAAQGWDVVPIIDARATPSGTVDDAMFERYWQAFAADAGPELVRGVAAIYLVLHGAMATASIPDVEGELLARIRALPGAATVPIFGVLDLHANVSAQMCRLANGLVMYRENPHIDAKAAAERGAELLARCLRENVVPRMHWCRPPIVWAPSGTGTQSDPMRALEAWARELEATSPGIWACNVAAGYSFADTPDTGCSLSVVTTGPAAEVRGQLLAGARLAWERREQGNVVLPPVDTVVAQLPSTPDEGGPLILVEPADNIGGGAPGDGTGVLRSLLRHRIARGLVAINDPAAVVALADAAVGEVHRITVGGREWAGDEGPVELEATLISRSDGRFTLEDRQSHLASIAGVHIDMGPCVVVQSSGVTVLLTSRKTPPFDLGQLRSQGLEPAAFAVIGVKAAVAHRRAYDPIAGRSISVSTPGPCTSDLATLPWRQLRRPVFPLDPGAGPEPLFA